MAKLPKRPRDLNEWAKRMVDIATGEVSNGDSTRESPPVKGPSEKPRKPTDRPASAKKV